MDMRSVAVLATKTGDSLFVAFGENWGTAFLRDHGKDKSPFDVNGKFMKDNPDLLRFIDEHVYGPHPRDYWFQDEVREFLRLIERSNRVGDCFQPELTNAVFETIDFDKEKENTSFRIRCLVPVPGLISVEMWIPSMFSADQCHCMMKSSGIPR